MAKSKIKNDDEFSSLVETLNKKYGTGSFKKASEFDLVKEVTSTGCIGLDKAIGVGGIPKGGKITHILGLPASGKTTLSAHIIVEEQKKGNLCCFLDIEGTCDLKYFQKIGVNLDMLFLADPSNFKTSTVSGEEWLMFCSDLILSNQFGIIVLDSVAALTPSAELQESWSNMMGKLSRMLSQGFRTITTSLLKSDTGLILLNQYRMNPNSMGNPYVEAGGEALKYYVALKIELSKSLDKDKTTNEVLGGFVKAKITKNKLAMPYGKTEYYISLSEGIDGDYEVFKLGVDYGLINKTGNTFTYNEIKLGVGEKKTLFFLKDNPELLQEIKEKILNIDVKVEFDTDDASVILDNIVNVLNEEL